MKIMTNKCFEEEINKRIAKEREIEHMWDQINTLENTVRKLAFKVRCLEKPGDTKVRSE